MEKLFEHAGSMPMPRPTGSGRKTRPIGRSGRRRWLVICEPFAGKTAREQEIENLIQKLAKAGYTNLGEKDASIIWIIDRKPGPRMHTDAIRQSFVANDPW